ncbi:MAG: 50S ribosomal protein L19 [Alphaproteobacteria bacterium]|nr:50S ribosomal protein L19 [Alphaproteobacteria bacterium]USO07454.1 MAG: 50S ribosomal protein L19 [Rhodospirillales bacterium]
MNTIEKFEAQQLKRLSEQKKIPVFSPGDTLKVNVNIKEGDRSRIQAYEGVCISRTGGGINESFTVRKISYGEGVERVFPLYSPVIDSIELVRRGSVRRAKLYYMRGRSGKSARITERTTGHGLNEGTADDAAPAEAAEAAPTPKKEKKAAKA